jgi:hypothetical protein
MPPAPVTTPLIKSTVESAATIAVTNITGLRINVRGSSLTKESRAAAAMSGPVNSEVWVAISKNL